MTDLARIAREQTAAGEAYRAVDESTKETECSLHT